MQANNSKLSTGASLTGASLRGAIANSETKFPDGFDAEGAEVYIRY
jgi:hypothetical protein